MALLNFTGEGQYGSVQILQSVAEHAGYLQHHLRQSDVRECMIMGATPWRALHLPLGIKGAETYTVLGDCIPIAMFGVVPQHNDTECSASIWMLGSYGLEDHVRTWLRLTSSVFDYFQQSYDLLENVVPIDHRKTIKWLTLSGCAFAQTSTVINGYECVRFVRCVDWLSVSFEEDEQPVSY